MFFTHDWRGNNRATFQGRSSPTLASGSLSRTTVTLTRSRGWPTSPRTTMSMARSSTPRWCAPSGTAAKKMRLAASSSPRRWSLTGRKYGQTTTLKVPPPDVRVKRIKFYVRSTMQECIMIQRDDLVVKKVGVEGPPNLCNKI